MSINTGSNAVLDDILSYQVFNKIKNSWRSATAPADAQPGSVFSDSDTDQLYHAGAASAQEEILQLTRSKGSSPKFATLKLMDTNASHSLALKWNEDRSADQTLNIVTGAADRTVTLSGNPTLADWFDQEVKAASSPAFVTVKCSGLTDGYVPYHVSDAAGLANSPIIISGSNVGIGTVPAFVFHIKNTTAQFCAQRDSDNNSGPTFRLMKTRTTGVSAQDNDITGYLTFDFYNDNATPELINAAYLRGLVTDVSDGTEDGTLEVHVTVNGVDRTTVIFSDVNSWFYGDVSALTFTDRP